MIAYVMFYILSFSFLLNKLSAVAFLLLSICEKEVKNDHIDAYFLLVCWEILKSQFWLPAEIDVQILADMSIITNVSYLVKLQALS